MHIIGILLKHHRYLYYIQNNFAQNILIAQILHCTNSYRSLPVALKLYYRYSVKFNMQVLFILFLI